MRRSLHRGTALAASLALAFAASACGTQQGDAVTRDLTDVEVVTSGERQAPTLQVPAPFSVATSDELVTRLGDGRPVAEGDVIGMQYVLVNGRTGEQVTGSDWAGPPTSLVVDDSILTGLRAGLLDQPVGSEVLVAVAPQDGFEGQAAPPQQGIEASDTLLFLVDIRTAVPPRAEGTPVEPRPGLPTVTLGADGEPKVAIAAGSTPPGELVVETLIEGTGVQVQVGQTIRVQYTGVKYADGSVFDSSWANGSPATFVIGEGKVIEGWDVGLVGQEVGSQVLLIVPPANGYREAGQKDAGISGTDTLVFVVDILAAG